MLQRAANNAYSWWWASHIRTKQSKWLDQSFQDMEEKVQSMLKLIEEDGDSFAKRAEMYYKRRPELINSVEESFRAFRALADRYDHLSKELQNANRTIASVFPEQVPFAMDEDDDFPTPKIPKNSQIPPTNMDKVPKVPKLPLKDIKGLISTASKRFHIKKSAKVQSRGKAVVKSGYSRDAARCEIDKLQKDILGLQTVKEFVKSSYESGLAKYWEIENQIMEMQQKVCSLQDEFNVDTLIDDDEARTLMAEAALKSCQETLAQLQEKQEKSTREAREECKKIEASRQRLKSLRQEYLHDLTHEDKTSEDDKTAKTGNELRISTKEIGEVIQETKGIEALQVKTIESLDLSSTASMTVTDLAEKIDELVNKVISLENEVSSQTVLINTLKTEAGELHEQIQSLEDQKDTVIDGTHNLRTKVKDLEGKLKNVQDINKNVERQNSTLQTNFTEARSSLDHLSEKLTSVTPDEEIEQANSSHDEARSLSEDKLKEELKDKKYVPSQGDSGDKSFSASKTDNGGNKSFSASKTDNATDVKEQNIEVQDFEPSDEGQDKKLINKSVAFLVQKPEEQILEDHSDYLVNVKAQGVNIEALGVNVEAQAVNTEAQGDTEKEEGLNWQQMLLSGMEDREKILLTEYTAMRRNFKEVKKKLSDVEKKERDTQFDTFVQMRELKQAILKRDEEIQHLRQKLKLQQGNKTEAGSDDLEVNEDVSTPITNKEDEIRLVFVDRTPFISAVEEKFRMDIDAILDENLDFWLRFSTSFHQIQKFKTEVQDLQDEISKLREKKKQGGSVTTRIKSEVLPIYKHLREIQTELTLWLEQSVSLKDELKRRLASLCSIQEEITKALKEGAEEEEIRFSSHQAAKLQGEILNMKQENNKVREELETGLDHVSVLQLQIEKTLRKLNEEFGISSHQPQLKNAMSRSRVPLRSFLFGTRQKKQKHSIFSCMHPNRRYHILRAGMTLTNPNS